MKKTLALILALMMAVCMFAACSKDETKKESANAPEDVVSAYMECLMADDDKAVDYTEKDSQGYDMTVDALGSRATIKSQLKEFIGAPESFEEKVSDYFDSFLEKAYSKADFEIGAVNVVEDQATVEVKATSPSYYNIETATNNVDMMAILEENFPEDFEPATEEEADEATFKIMQLLFDAVLEDSSIYEEENIEMELEKQNDKWVIVNIRAVSTASISE